VTKLVPESSTVTSVYLTAEDGEILPQPAAGQYITLRAAGAGDPSPVRSYSLSSRPGAGSYRISVKREPRGIVSTYLHSRLRPGAVLDVAAPRGEFVLTAEVVPVLLVSAGIGVTPVLAMLHQLAAADSTREVWWIHTARNAQEHAFADEAHQLLRSLPRAQERIFYTSPAADEPPVRPVIRGRPTLTALAGLGLPPDAVAYICGPAAFMDDIRDDLGRIGIPPDRVHTELFGALAAINPGLTDVRHATPHRPPGPEGTGPQITFARSGLSVRWAERHGSLLALADACDVPTRYSCRTGVCHTCVTPLLSGAVNYSPNPLEPPASGTVLVCCSRPDTDLVLDM
jgi:ferredoxin-NADP reductase